MGIVYYARYFEYFEEARTELLRSIGVNVTEIEDDGYYLPVISCNCKYKRSAKFDEELQVITRIKEQPHALLKIEYDVINSENILYAKGETVHSFINKNGKPVKPPKEFLNKLNG